MKPGIHKLLSTKINPGKLSIFLMVVMFPLLLSCSRTKTEYFENGNTKSELTYKGGELDGVATWWYENGEKKMESHYTEGSLEGRSIRWYKNGKIERVEVYKNNMLNGRVATYSERGKPLTEEYYINDTLHGMYKVWHVNGEVKVRGRYHKGMFDGKWVYRSETGKIIGVGDFDKGTGTLTHYYENGRKERVVHYIDNQKHGQEVFWGEDGDMEARVIYDRGEVLSSYGIE